MTDKAPLRSTQELDLAPKSAMHPSPSDWRDHFIYFLLVDRFNDGKRHPKYNGSRAEGTRSTDIGRRMQAGTLKGVTQRLKYIKKLGATAVWISPVFKNRLAQSGAYSGYAMQDFLEIDPNLGTKEDLRELVKVAHEMGMYIILDIVINHTGDNWAYENDSHPQYNHDGARYPFGFWRAEHQSGNFSPEDAVWPAELQNPESYKRRGSVVDWNNDEELIHGDFLDLKALDLNDGGVLATLMAVYKYWIAEADIDGYRIDTVKHVENGPAVKFFNSIKEYAASIGKKNFFLFGEIVAGDDTITKFVGRQAPTGESLQALDAALDFPLYFVLEEVIKGFASPSLLRERAERVHRLYPSADASDCFVTFLDNHDQMARPYRRFLHDDSHPEQALLGIAYLLTGIGIPSIYYGTEQGFDGGASSGAYHDTYLRENMFGGAWGAFGTTGMHFFDERHPLYKGIAKVAAIRQREPALRYGRLYFREISEDGETYRYPELGFGMLAYSRILDTMELLVVINLRNEKYTNHISMDKTLNPPGSFLVGQLSKKEYLVDERAERSSVTITLGAHGIAILKQKAVAG